MLQKYCSLTSGFYIRVFIFYNNEWAELSKQTIISLSRTVTFETKQLVESINLNVFFPSLVEGPIDYNNNKVLDQRV